jgi:hypothetical protein
MDLNSGCLTTTFPQDELEGTQYASNILFLRLVVGTRYSILKRSKIDTVQHFYFPFRDEISNCKSLFFLSYCYILNHALLTYILSK